MVLERIKRIIEHHNSNISAFERSIGASEGVIRRALKNNTDIQGKWLVQIAEKYPDISPNWLLTGRGAMLDSGQQPQILEEGSENYQASSQKSLIDALRDQIDLLKEANSMLKERNEELKNELSKVQRSTND